MDKTFIIAGTSLYNGELTYRFSNDKIKVRADKLKRHGHIDIDLVELPRAMTRQEAIDHLVAMGRSAVLPTNRKERSVQLTEEQQATADEAAKKAEFVRRMQEARERKKREKLAAEDHNFMAELTGDAKVPVPEAQDDPEEVHAQQGEIIAGADELLAIVDSKDETETA